MRTIFLLCVLSVCCDCVRGTPTNGPLSVCRANPRYFADRDGKAVLLVGSHVWYNLVDMGPTDPPEPFDYDAYLDWMRQLNHNFMRMWAWEMVQWDTHGNNPNNRNEITKFYVQPHPYLRTGPGEALDGKPRFDLTQFDPAYFERMRTRVEAARDKGIYVSVMLFEGWAMQMIEDGFKLHPFHPANNINGINGDADGDGKGLEVHELVVEAVTEIQKAYVRKVIDTVNGLDNVLYEISNENHPGSTQWQYAMIQYIRQYESGKPMQHPIGMTYQFKGGKNRDLFLSPADWVSPNPDGGYRDNPHAATGKKVVIADTDHLWGIGGNEAWVWKSFARGLNPIFMDPYDGVVLGKRFDPQFERLRKSMGITLRLAERMDLNRCKPLDGLASTGYCLADPAREYLVYQPTAGEDVTVELEAGEYTFEWLEPSDTRVQDSGTISVSDGERNFANPLPGHAALFIH